MPLLRRVFPDRISKLVLDFKAIAISRELNQGNQAHTYVREALAHYALFKGIVTNRVSTLIREYYLLKEGKSNIKLEVIQEGKRMVKITDPVKREEAIVNHIVRYSQSPLKGKFLRAAYTTKGYTLSEEINPFIIGEFFRDAQGKRRLLLKLTFYPEGEKFLAVILDEEVKQLKEQIGEKPAELFAKVYFFLRANVPLRGYKDMEVEIVTDNMNEIVKRIHGKGNIRDLVPQDDIKVFIDQQDKEKIRMMHEIALKISSREGDISAEEIRAILES
jgi:hypothetical protein